MCVCGVGDGRKGDRRETLERGGKEKEKGKREGKERGRKGD